MSKLLIHRAFIRENLVFLIGLCLCLYFVYHAIQGNRSFLRMLSLNSQIEKTTAEHETLAAERAKLEAKVVMMRPGSLSKDMLEERARAVLGYQRPDEMQVLD